jgi:hypothetical protein
MADRSLIEYSRSSVSALSSIPLVGSSSSHAGRSLNVRLPSDQSEGIEFSLDETTGADRPCRC